MNGKLVPMLLLLASSALMLALQQWVAWALLLSAAMLPLLTEKSA